MKFPALRPALRLPLAIGALALALTLLALATIAALAATLAPAEREALAALLAPRAMLGVAIWCVVFALAAWGLAHVHERFVAAPARLAEAAQARLVEREPSPTDGADAGVRDIAAQGSAAQRALTEVVNALLRERTLLRVDIERQVAQASRGIESERSRLSALMAELTQSVLVCNRDGRIVLVNASARAQLRAWSRAPASAGGAELIGIGRSIHAVFEPALLAHALQTLDERAQADAADAVDAADAATQFVTHTPAGRLLRVQMAAVRAAAAGAAVSGYVLMLDDITAEIEQQALRDRLLLGLTEGTRASLGNLRAALEMLELPDLDPTMRERFQRIVRDEVAAMTERLRTASAEQLAQVKTRWPLEDIRGADFVAAVKRRIETTRSLRVGLDEVDEALWLRLDSYSLLDALTYLAERLAAETDVKSVRLRLTAADARRARLDLVWSGAMLSTETAMGWQVDSMNGTSAQASPLAVRDVVERHGGEFWFERERVRHEAFFRFLLPCTSAAEQAARAEPVRDTQRPEFYDFDLFETTPAARALDDVPLAELVYTVFDTETTGLNPSQGDEIIQIGATRIVNGKLLRHECFEQLVDPKRPLAPESVAVHGIEPARLAGQPTIAEVLPVFHAFARDTVLVAHNAAFDMRFLELKQAASGLRFDQPVLDTMLLSACLHPNQDSHALEAIAQRLGVAVTGRHTALGDALVTGQVFLRLMPLLQARGLHTLGQVREASLRTYRARLKY